MLLTCKYKFYRTFCFVALTFSKNMGKLASFRLVMMKNIILQFTELYNMTCTCVCIVNWWRNCLYASKLKAPVVFQKRDWDFAFAFEHLWLELKLLNLPFPFKLHPATLEKQLNYWKCFVTMPFFLSNYLSTILCRQSFLLHCFSLTCWKLLPFFGSI